jgi:hypothetical protein
MKKKILQKIADSILEAANKAVDNDDMVTFKSIYDFGVTYDYICIYYFDVYLD